MGDMPGADGLDTGWLYPTINQHFRFLRAVELLCQYLHPSIPVLSCSNSEVEVEQCRTLSQVSFEYKL